MGFLLGGISCAVGGALQTCSVFVPSAVWTSCDLSQYQSHPHFHQLSWKAGMASSSSHLKKRSTRNIKTCTISNTNSNIVDILVIDYEYSSTH